MIYGFYQFCVGGWLGWCTTYNENKRQFNSTQFDTYMGFQSSAQISVNLVLIHFGNFAWACTYGGHRKSLFFYILDTDQSLLYQMRY